MNSFLASFSWAIIPVIFAFVLNLLVYGFNWRRIQPFSKPLAMITIIFWTLSMVEWQMDWQMALLIIAQVFGLAGDIFLLFPKGWFMAGLAAFLVGHLFYIALTASILVYHLNSGAIEPLSPFILVLGAMILVVAMLVFLRVFKPAFNSKKSRNKLWFAVQVYAFILSSMMVASFVMVFKLPIFTWQSALVPIGSALFFASDFMLAYDRFVHKNALLRLLVWISYHLAQICLAWGFGHLLI